MKRDTGISALGKIPWGTHFCMFYQNKQDLLDIILPYVKKGCKMNESSIVLTTEPLKKEELLSKLRENYDNLELLLDREQIQIDVASDFYLEEGKLRIERLLKKWVNIVENRLEKGFDGLRVIANIGWLTEKDWEKFTEYEREVNDIISQYNLIVICAYPLDICGPYEILDVLKNHEFALIRRAGEWERFKTFDQLKAEEKYRAAYNQTQLYQDIFMHDINNIIQNVRSASDLVQNLTSEKINSNEVADLFKIINDQLVRGTKLVDNVNKISRVNGDIESLKPVKIVPKLEEAIDFIKKSYPQKDITIKMNNSFSIPPRTNANALLLDVFENILINAIKHNENPHIQIKIILKKHIRHGMKFIQIHFKDNGIGIPDPMKKRLMNGILENKKRVKGLGLGLLTVKKLIQQYNGKFIIKDRVKGTYSKGTDIIIELPLHSQK